VFFELFLCRLLSYDRCTYVRNFCRKVKVEVCSRERNSHLTSNSEFATLPAVCSSIYRKAAFFSKRCATVKSPVDKNVEENLPPLDRESLSSEVEISTFRGSGPGGQHRNKTESAVRLRHVPTGITVVAAEHRSQWRNRQAAWERLIERLERRRQKPKPRLKTRVPAVAKRKRLEEKKLLAAKKQRRAKPPADE
jgi:protein subunit release factor B